MGFHLGRFVTAWVTLILVAAAVAGFLIATDPSMIDGLVNGGGP